MTDNHNQEVQSNRLRLLREQQHLTQQQLAKRLGVSNVTVHRWETGRRGLNSLMIEKLAEIFGCTRGELFDSPDVLLGDPDAMSAIELLKNLGDEQKRAWLHIGAVISQRADPQEESMIRLWRRMSETKRRVWLEVGLALANEEDRHGAGPGDDRRERVEESP